MNQAGLSSILVAMALLAIGVIVVAQQPAKIPRIGIVAGASGVLHTAVRAIPARQP